MQKYELMNEHVNGFQIIRITVGKFQGVKYTYGSVAFENIDYGEEIRLQFEYNVIEGVEKISDYEEFKQLTGDTLVAILQSQINTGDVIYGGGKD